MAYESLCARGELPSTTDYLLAIANSSSEEIAVHKYNNVEPEISPHTRRALEQAKRFCIRSLAPYCAGFRPATSDFVVSKMKPNTSSSFTGTRYGAPTKQELWSDESYHHYFMSYVRSMHTRNPMPTFAKFIMKREVLKVSKLMTNEQRVITALPPESNYALNKYELELWERIISTAGRHWLGLGFTSQYGGFNDLILRLQKHKNAFAADIKLCDSTTYRFLLEAAWDVMVELSDPDFIDPDDPTIPPSQNYLAWKNAFISACTAYCVNSFGQVFRVFWRMLSGRSDTLPVNCLCSYLTYFTCVNLNYYDDHGEFPSYDQIQSNFEMMITGDDLDGSVSDEFKKYATPERIRVAAWLYLGRNVLFESEEFMPPEDLEHCSQKPHQNDDGLWVPHLNADKMLASMLFGGDQGTVFDQVSRIASIRNAGYPNPKIDSFCIKMITEIARLHPILTECPEWTVALKQYLSAKELRDLWYGSSYRSTDDLKLVMQNMPRNKSRNRAKSLPRKALKTVRRVAKKAAVRSVVRQMPARNFRSRVQFRRGEVDRDLAVPMGNGVYRFADGHTVNAPSANDAVIIHRAGDNGNKDMQNQRTETLDVALASSPMPDLGGSMNYHKVMNMEKQLKHRPKKKGPVNEADFNACIAALMRRYPDRMPPFPGVSGTGNGADPKVCAKKSVSKIFLTSQLAAGDGYYYAGMFFSSLPTGQFAKLTGVSGADPAVLTSWTYSNDPIVSSFASTCDQCYMNGACVTVKNMSSFSSAGGTCLALTSKSGTYGTMNANPWISCTATFNTFAQSDSAQVQNFEKPWCFGWQAENPQDISFKNLSDNLYAGLTNYDVSWVIFRSTSAQVIEVELETSWTIVPLPTAVNILGAETFPVNDGKFQDYTAKISEMAGPPAPRLEDDQTEESTFWDVLKSLGSTIFDAVTLAGGGAISEIASFAAGLLGTHRTSTILRQMAYDPLKHEEIDAIAILPPEVRRALHTLCDYRVKFRDDEYLAFEEISTKRRWKAEIQKTSDVFSGDEVRVVCTSPPELDEDSDMPLLDLPSHDWVEAATEPLLPRGDHSFGEAKFITMNGVEYAESMICDNQVLKQFWQGYASLPLTRERIPLLKVVLDSLADKLKTQEDYDKLDSSDPVFKGMLALYVRGLPAPMGCPPLKINYRKSVTVPRE